MSPLKTRRDYLSDHSSLIHIEDLFTLAFPGLLACQRLLPFPFAIELNHIRMPASMGSDAHRSGVQGPFTQQLSRATTASSTILHGKNRASTFLRTANIHFHHVGEERKACYEKMQRKEEHEE